jgi:hypothetical protein
MEIEKESGVGRTQPNSQWPDGCYHLNLVFVNRYLIATAIEENTCSHFKLKLEDSTYKEGNKV